MRFVGIGLNDNVLDSNTVWNFENRLAEAGLMEELFCIFDRKLENEGLITQKGTIVYATFVDVPRQRNHHDENKKIKEGKIPEEWEKPENKHKLSQKDRCPLGSKKQRNTFRI